MRSSALYTLAASIASASAAYQGFNYGSTYTDGSAIVQSGYEALFNTAKNLAGHSNAFTSARLYTMVQAGTSNGVISAIPAAINTRTTLLLGLWGSGGQAYFSNELSALSAAISQYGTAFTSLIAGISIGSEDLYRNSPIGIINKSGIGAQPDELVSYINQVRSLIAGTSAASAPIGHVDTWTAWVNGSNDAVIQACDFLGMDAYPYFQNTMANSIENGNATFFQAYDNTVGNSFGKPVWITETGWPVSGPTQNLAVASLANARIYWEQVACTVLGNINTWWYTLQDAYPVGPPPPSFGIVGTTLSTTPLYDLSCPEKSSTTSSTTASSAAPTTLASEITFSATSASLISTDTSLVGTASPTAVVLSSNSEAMTSEASTNSETVPSPTSYPTTSTEVGPSTMVMVTSYPVTMTDEATTYTTFTTEVITITSCSNACSEQPTTVRTEETYYTTATEVSLTSATTTAFATAAAAPTGVCTTDILSGTYEYPHLIVPVSSEEPTKVFGTSYFGEVSSTISTIFNFDIPASDAGKTCTLVFLFPTQAQLETSSYTISGTGGLHFQELSSPATETTTYDTVPAAAGLETTLPSVTPGHSYVVASHECGAGERISFEVSATGSLGLQYFQDYNLSPIGLYISVC